MITNTQKHCYVIKFLSTPILRYITKLRAFYDYALYGWLWELCCRRPSVPVGIAHPAPQYRPTIPLGSPAESVLLPRHRLNACPNI